MTIFSVSLAASVLLCSMVAGFLFAYAIVIMPGIKRLPDQEFLRTFQVTDRVIQKGHPLFLLVWVGSVIALVVCAIASFGQPYGFHRVLVLFAAAAYLLGVQATTFTVHLPLNNRLQKLDLNAMTQEQLSTARARFEPRWNRFNEVRTAIACAVSLALIYGMFTIDARALPPNADPVVGRAAIDQLTALYLESGISEFRQETTDFCGNEQMLIDQGNYVMVYRKENTVEMGKYLNV